MDQELDRVVQAIAIASDPLQSSLHLEVLAYIASVEQNASETWRLALHLFVDQNEDGSHKHPVQARFFALRVLDQFFDNRFEPFDEESFRTIQRALVSYIQSEYAHGPAEADAAFLRNKFSHTLALFYLCTYINQWPSFFVDLFTLMRPAQSSSSTNVNRHISLLFFHIVLEISGEVADQMIKTARSYDAVRHARDARVRDAVRDRDASRINEAVLAIVSEGATRMANLKKDEGSNSKEYNEVVEVVDWGIRTFGSYVGWIDINLTVTPTTVPLLINLLAESSLPIRLATSVALLRIVTKGLKEPGDKLQLLKVLSLGQVLDALEDKTRAQQIERGSDVDEGEESYREALGKLINVFGLELAKVVDECPHEDLRSEATTYLIQVQAVMLRFLADEYDDTCSTVFPLLQVVLGNYKRLRKISTEPLDSSKRSFLSSLLQILLTKMKWEEDADPDDVDENDNAEFEKMRKELRVFLDSIFGIDQQLVTDAIQTFALNTISAFQNEVAIKWNDAELGVYLVFIFGEINKSGGKGRTAFCQAPAVDKDKRKGIDYTEYPLTPHGEMLYALAQSGISSYPHYSVSLQFFEAVARYSDFFKIRKECIIPTLEAMIGTCGVHSDNSSFRARLFYLFYRFIKDIRNEIPRDIITTIIDNMRDLLPVSVEIPELEEGESDRLSEAVKNTIFDSQLYLYETAGILCSLTHKDTEQQRALLLSLVKPLMDGLSTNFQLFLKGGQDILLIVTVHHTIMALGSIAKGFPDYPTSIPENYVSPPLNVFSEVAQAILVCLESMNVLKVVRDASRFAFARIMATAGPSVTRHIPQLMDNLLAHFEPSELVDFMNFIGLLIHKLQKEMLSVLDQLIGPLSAHINVLLSQPISGTDDQRAHIETKKSYLALLNNIMAARLQGIFTSERNVARLEALIENMQRLAEDISDPACQRVALTFLNRCVVTWGQPPNSPLTTQNEADGNEGLPGFETFIYERLIPTAFRIPSHADFNLKDGQVVVVVHEIANLLQAICKTRGPEAYDFFLNVFLPAQGWPPEMAGEFTTKLRDLEGKNFRKYFTELLRSSRTPST